MSTQCPELYAPAAEVGEWRREARASRYDRAVVRALAILRAEERYRDAFALARAADKVRAEEWREPSHEWLLAMCHALARYRVDGREIGDLLLAALDRLDVEQRARHEIIERELDAEEVANDVLH